VGAVRAVGEGAVGQVRGACAAGTRPGGHVGLCLCGVGAGVAATKDAAAAALTRAAQKNCASADAEMRRCEDDEDGGDGGSDGDGGSGT
jgi:hypothetical protein